jgi:hypothetical protein
VNGDPEGVAATLLQELVLAAAILIATGRRADRDRLGGLTSTVVSVSTGREPDLAEELELRDELLMACRVVLLGVAPRAASALVAHIDALLDLDDEASPGSQR